MECGLGVRFSFELPSVAAATAPRRTTGHRVETAGFGLFCFEGFFLGGEQGNTRELPEKSRLGFVHKGGLNRPYGC